MTRYDVAIEGKPTVDGRFIRRGALRPHTGPIPVTDRGPNGDLSSRLIGRADGFERAEDGTISLEVTLFEEFDLTHMNKHIEVIDMTIEDGEVTDGVLRGLFVSAGPGGWRELDVPLLDEAEALATERRINEGFTARLTAALEALARVEALAADLDQSMDITRRIRAAAALAPATTPEES